MFCGERGAKLEIQKEKMGVGRERRECVKEGTADVSTPTSHGKHCNPQPAMLLAYWTTLFLGAFVVEMWWQGLLS